MPIHYLSQAKKSEIAGKTCLLRADLNVEKGFEKDAFRLQTIIPTIKFLLKNKCRVVIISHRGRPQSRSNYPAISNQQWSLQPFVVILNKKLRENIVYINHFNFRKIKEQIQQSKNNVFLLENIRFLVGEEKNASTLAKQLATLGDFYVNDAFPVCHRKNASVVAITKFLPSYAGLRLEEEIKQLNAVMIKPARPFTVIIGGAKIADKLGVVKNFFGSASRRKADYFLFGGGPANTLLAAKGVDVGNSITDTTFRGRTSQVLKFVRSGSLVSKIFLPSDFKTEKGKIYPVRNFVRADAPERPVKQTISNGIKILDIGPQTIKEYAKIIQQSQTIIWNGPMGLFEKKGFANGTLAIWKTIFATCRMSHVTCHAVIGGGETIASLQFLNPQPSTLNPHIFLSTGGTAMLEYLSGKKLPGIEALKR